jgi:hypothetical protein
MKCEIKKGIFVLRVCDEKAFVACSVCRRSVCAQHIDKSSAAQIVCVECAATQFKQQQSTNKQVLPQKATEVLDNFWYYQTRMNFYHSHSSYRPFDYSDYKNFQNQIQDDAFEQGNESEVANFLDS